MAETPSGQIWIGRLAFIAVAVVLIFAQLVPLDARPSRWPAPDLLLAVTFAWVARRPDFIPVTTIAAVILLTDILFQRPPGLFAALVVVFSEVIRSRASTLRNLTFMAEWSLIGLCLTGLALSYRFALAMAMTPQPPLQLTILQTAATIACYPAVVLVARFVFGVARPAPGQVNSYGHRI